MMSNDISSRANLIDDHGRTSRQSRVTSIQEAESFAGPQLTRILLGFESTNPALGRSIIEDAFGDKTLGLGYRELALHSLSVLAAIGDSNDQLEFYLEVALKHGATEDEILAVINLAASLAGAPRGVYALRCCHAKLVAARESPDVSVTERIIRLADHETLVRDTGGRGVPYVFIHALSMDGRMFQKLAPRLATQGIRVITYDLRGHGHARGAPLTQSLEHLVADLLLLLDMLSLDKVDVLGCSFGGAVAQSFTLVHPSRVRSLCPMATGPKATPILVSRATRAENGEMPSLRTEAIMRWFRPESIADDSWCVRYARRQVERVTIEEWAAAWRAMASLDCFDRITQTITCPMLVVAGAMDQSATPERMRPLHEEAHKAGRDSQYVELEKGTHMMAMESPDEVAGVLLTFRERLDRDHPA